MKVTNISKTYNFFGIFIFIFSCFSFMVNRDQRLLTNLGLENRRNRSEFSGVADFCNDLPACFRIGSSWIGELINVVLFQVVKVVQKFPSRHYEISSDTYTDFLYNFSSLIYRFILLFTMLYLIYTLTKNFLFSTLLISMAILYSSHIFHYLFLSLLSSIQLINLESQIQATFRILDMYLVYYDYAALLSVGSLILLHFLHLTDRFILSWYKLFIITFFLTSIFEYLGILLAISFIFTKYKEKKLYFFYSLLGSLTYIIVIYSFLTVRATEDKQNTGTNKTLLDTYLYYFLANLENIPSIILGVCLIIILPIFLGLLLGFLSRNLMNFKVQKSIIYAFEPILIALPLIFLVGFFTSGIGSEFARQALPFEFYVFIYYYLRTISSNSKQNIKIDL